MKAKSTLPVAVIGAGPVGLAAAARLLERGETPLVTEAGASAGAAIRQWAHVRLFSPWRYLVDAASRSLLEREGWQEPDPDAKWEREPVSSSIAGLVFTGIFFLFLNGLLGRVANLNGGPADEAVDMLPWINAVLIGLILLYGTMLLKPRWNIVTLSDRLGPGPRLHRHRVPPAADIAPSSKCRPTRRHTRKTSPGLSIGATFTSASS